MKKSLCIKQLTPLSISAWFAPFRNPKSQIRNRYPLSILIIFSLFFNSKLAAQTERDPNLPVENYIKKTLKAVKATKVPKIDGDLSDEAWQNAAVAKDFVQNKPKPFGIVSKSVFKNLIWLLSYLNV